MYCVPQTPKTCRIRSSLLRPRVPPFFCVGKKSGGSCTGPTITVRGNGKATVTVGATDAVAIQANRRV